MCLADLLGTHDVVTAAASAEVPDNKPAICGTVTVHCSDGDETVSISMPMLDALLLLNSLRVIERQFELQGWSQQIGCDAELMAEAAAELELYTAEMSLPATAIN